MINPRTSKISKLIGGNFEFGDPIGIGATPSLFLAVIGEFVCPILIIVGFKTRWATVPTIITMLVAHLSFMVQIHLCKRKGYFIFGNLYLDTFIGSWKI